MAQYHDPNTGRPLPTPTWWLGTSHLRTEDEFYRHMTMLRDITAIVLTALTVIGLVLFVGWPSPGFGQGMAIIIWAWVLMMSPAYFIYRRDVKRFFGDWT